MAQPQTDLNALREQFRRASHRSITDSDALNGLADPALDHEAPIATILAAMDERIQRLEEETRSSSYKWGRAGTTAATGSTTAAATLGAYAAVDTFELPLECETFTIAFDDIYGGYFQICNRQYPEWGMLDEELVRGPRAIGYPCKITKVRFRALDDSVATGKTALYSVRALGA